MQTWRGAAAVLPSVKPRRKWAGGDGELGAERKAWDERGGEGEGGGGVGRERERERKKRGEEVVIE